MYLLQLHLYNINKSIRDSMFADAESYRICGFDNTEAT